MNVLDTIKAAGIIHTKTTIDLGDCDKAYRGATFDVWVTPTRAHWAEYAAHVTEVEQRRVERDAIKDTIEREEFDRVMTERAEARLDAWLAETWLNIDTAGDVTQIREALQENYPAAWDWLYQRTLEVIIEYKRNLSKN